MKNQFRVKVLTALTALVVAGGLTGCLDGGGNSGSAASSGGSTSESTGGSTSTSTGGATGASTGGTSSGSTGSAGSLAAQTGQQFYLFYGNTNHQKLNSIKNIRIFDPANPSAVLTSNDDIMASSIGTPKVTMSLTGFTGADNSYTDLYNDKVNYVSGGAPKAASLKMTVGHNDTTHTDEVSKPTETAHSNATGLTAPSYTEIFYLGVKQFLTATNASGKKVIVFPSADGANSPEDFTNKTLLSVFYPSWGSGASGIIVYDSSTKKFQKMVPSVAGCTTCGIDPTSATFTDFTGLTGSTTYSWLGDIPNTTQSALIADGKLYILDRATMAITEKATTSKNTTAKLADLLGASGKGTSKFYGDSAFFIYKGSDNIANAYRLSAKTGELTQLTKDHGGAGITPTKFIGGADDWLFYGTDGLTLAVRKDADKATPKLLTENTKTSGQRWMEGYGTGADLLYQTYSINSTTGNTTYKACIFAGATGVSSCKDNSFWAAVTAARKGKLNFTSDYRYTPYAYVRVDGTDNFGGGVLKSINPAKPMDDGLAMGKVDTYNFHTFVIGSSYRKTLIDSNGYVVLYGKRDDTFVGDAFLMNLNKAGSVVNLSNEAAPSSALLNSGDLHCHNRLCGYCHNLAGGRMFNTDKATGTTVDQASLTSNIKLEFADGSSVIARKGKGKGENFSVLFNDIKGEFTPVLINASDNSEIKRASKFGHAGLSYSNCDYCHALTPILGAPAVINTVK